MTEKCFSFTLNHLVFVTIVQFINTLDGSMTNVLSVTHSSDKGDVFEVLANESVCATSCERFGGFLQKSDRRDNGGSHKCFCYCANLTKPTFYRTKIGQESCVKDMEVLDDTNEGKHHWHDQASYLDVTLFTSSSEIVEKLAVCSTSQKSATRRTSVNTKNVSYQTYFLL